jgi:hypothetical protein
MQGVAHYMTGETPTLEKHNKNVEKMDAQQKSKKVGLEWGMGNKISDCCFPGVGNQAIKSMPRDFCCVIPSSFFL